MTRRTAIVIVSIVDAMAWGAIAIAMVVSHSDAATKGLDLAAAVIVTVLYLVTGAPALVLGLRRRALGIALILAVLFPAALVAAFVVAVIAFA